MVTLLTPSNQIEIFISYSHEDEPLLRRLETHLMVLKRAGITTVWHGRDISAGENWRQQIDRHLSSAQIVLLLVSADFIASDYCYGVEFARAMERHEREEACVISIILRPSYWRGTPLEQLQVLPKGATPVTEWRDPEKAFESITQEIMKVAERLQNREPDDLPSGPKPRVTRRLSRLATIKQAVSTAPPLKYSLALALTVAVIAIVAAFVTDYRPQLLKAYLNPPQPSPSATALPTPSSEPLRSAPASPQNLRITITEFPPYDRVGGPDSKGHIAGTVEGSGREEYRVVIYSFTTLWFVQPTTAEPRTIIDPNGNWSADIRTGTKYAVLLVPRNFQPPPETSSNPTRLDGVVTFLEVEGKDVLRIRQKRSAAPNKTKAANTNP